jgi:hypothetical protein
MNFICEQTATTTQTCAFEASTSPAFFAGFSYGEVLQTTLLFFIFLILLFTMFYDHILGVKNKIPVGRPVQINFSEGKIIEYD